MAQFAVLIYADDSAHALDATPEDLAASDRHADELVQSGSMLIAHALTPGALARSVHADGVTDGPFIGDGPIVAGFAVLEAPDLDAAIALARSNPAVRSPNGGVEVRPVHSGGVVRNPAEEP
jgi:hypothetical protein